ncbi:MAG: penicillin-binding transpeptidase domain-containing protein [Defluviitaleaceae bacterium]|nr:penicillin-binding transpeptidase domain-containing protein [Defluviitaleaceae bacterium]
MRELVEDTGKMALRLLTNRIIWLLILTVILFYVLVAELFYLQIIISDTFRIAPPPTTTVELSIPAPRGNLYDRFGRPLTINNTAYIVTMDSTIGISNDALLELTRIFERNNEDFVIDFPMTTEWPYEFTLGGSTPENRQNREFRWKDDMAVPNPRDATAVESFLYLREWFGIDPDLSNEDVRRILNFRSQIFLRRFRPEIFVIATDVSFATVAAIEERNTFFTGVGIEIMTLREYPQGIYFAHILGYTGRVNVDDLAAFPDQGYGDDDMIGKTGLERSQETLMRGQQGSQLVEIHPATGRRVGTMHQVTQSIPGNDIFLTIDIDMQRRTYYILKDYLTEIAIRRLQNTTPGGDSRERPIPHQQVLTNLVQGGWIPIREIMESEDEYGAVYALRSYILEQFPEAVGRWDERPQIRQILIYGIRSGSITPAMILTAMVDMGILSDYNDFSARVRAGRSTVNSFIIEKLRLGELTPQMINIDPATGSVVVVDVRTGGVLAAVSYPSFDNNRLANRIDAEYYERINGLDPTHPMINRPFMEARAPGSTFKMITAAAGLEAGVITPTSTIFDRVTFTRAGRPPVNCWSRAGHGAINVAQAIAISCNYFFFETAFRLGNSQHSRIEYLNRFMEFFGLNQRSGVEIGEHSDTINRARTPNVMSSPQLKEFIHLNRDEFTPRDRFDWFDGDTVRTAIGQSYNNYSAAVMARYMAQIANNGERLPLHLVDSIANYRGDVIMQTTPTPDDTGMVLADSTLQAIQRGMILATEGHGTAVNNFRGFPIRVAGKTGTAQQIPTRLDHSSFGGYAPFEDPQIAVYVVVPFGQTRVLSASATHIARDVIYAFLRPEIEIERPQQVNAIMR